MMMMITIKNHTEIKKSLKICALWAVIALQKEGPLPKKRGPLFCIPNFLVPKKVISKKKVITLGGHRYDSTIKK